ncbi:hypothetical protein BJV77DRAFT_1090768 [Russula vinacea]|nr:hypothetical protein BJV77DRAFT_1090768 [Russula vinacea]
MTVPSVDQVVTSSTKYKALWNWQSQVSWVATQDTLNSLTVVVLRCNARDFNTGSELQQPLSELQSDLEATCVQCRRYSAKKGVRRVSSVLPKWMIGKFLHRQFARLQARITLIHYNFEAAVGQLEKQREQASRTAGSSLQIHFDTGFRGGRNEFRVRGMGHGGSRKLGVILAEMQKNVQSRAASFLGMSRTIAVTITVLSIRTHLSNQDQSWEVVIRHVTDLFNVVDVSFLTTGSPEAANTLFDLSQTLEDLGMHHYSYTVATWAQVLRRDLYNSDKDMHRRDLASSYCLKARVLGGLGRTNAAIAAAHEAVRLCYEDQALQGVQLAKALYIQAPLLNAVGRKAEAKVVAKEMSTTSAGPSTGRINSARALIGVVDSRPALSIALLIKARVLAARREKSSAYISAVHAVRHLRDLTSERPTFTTFLAHALVLSSRYLHAAGFYWEARKGAEEAVQVHQTLHTFASQAFAAHYAEALGQLVRLRVAPDGTLMTTSRRRRRRRSEEQEQEDEEDDDDDEAAEVFDMAQHAAGLFRETTIRDSEALADVLLVIANTLFDESRAQEAAPNAEEAVGILRPRWKRTAEEYAPRFVRALGLAAACRPESEAGLEYAKEAVEAHRPRRDLDQATHEQILTHLLMDVFSRLKEMGREVEAIPWKTEAARLNVDVVESMDPPAPGADYHKGLLGGTMEYPEGSEDEAEDI